MKKTISLFPSVLVMLLLFSCSNDSRSIKDMLNSKSNEDTNISEMGVKVYNFTANIDYGAVSDDITMALRFLPGNKRVIWTGITRFGYEAPLGIGSYDAETGEIKFDNSDPLNGMGHLHDNPVIRLVVVDKEATLYIVEGDDLKSLFNSRTKFKLKESTTPPLENSLEGTKWNAEDGEVIKFISGNAVMIEDKVRPYTYNKGRIAITTGDNPIDDEVVVGHVNDNTMDLQRDGLLGDADNKGTLKKF